MPRKSIFVIIVICFSLVVSSWSSLSAENMRGAGDANALERIKYVQNALDEGKVGAQAWWGFWICGYTLLSVGQYTLAGKAGHFIGDFPRKDQWVNYLVGGIKSTLTLTLLCAMPFTPAYVSNNLAAMPQGSAAEINAKLGMAESLLEGCARKEMMGQAWYKHVIGLAVNMAGGAIIAGCQKGKVENRWKDAFISFGSGMIAFEATVLSQPMRAVKDWDNYKCKYGVGKKTALREEEDETDQWYVTVYPGGLGMGMHF